MTSTPDVHDTVFILGAGFTKGFLPDAPLLRDDYGAEELAATFKELDAASRLLERERDRYGDGSLNIETLMTRLEGLMPYDTELGVQDELHLLLSRVKQAFVNRLRRAQSGPKHVTELQMFARHCVENHCSVITFNYDDTFDEALWKVTEGDEVADRPYWHPDGGYGFYCRPAAGTVVDLPNRRMDTTSMLLLKLHGSLNWWIRRGYAGPYALEAIVHNGMWLELNYDGSSPPSRGQIEAHLEDEPFIVPPVLFKSALNDQPILRFVWKRAFDALRVAKQVYFIGYSFPVTDLASTFLFQEALDLLPRENIFARLIGRVSGRFPRRISTFAVP